MEPVSYFKARPRKMRQDLGGYCCMPKEKAAGSSRPCFYPQHHRSPWIFLGPGLEALGSELCWIMKGVVSSSQGLSKTVSSDLVLTLLTRLPLFLKDLMSSWRASKK